MKKVSLKYFLISLFMFMSIVPSHSYAQEQYGPTTLNYSGLVQCDGVVSPNEQDRQRVCDFNALMNTVKYLISWLFYITIPIAAVLFAYAGLLYLTGQKGNIETAKHIFQSAATGFIIMLIAWFAVVTVVNWFIDKNSKAGSSYDTLINTK